MSIDRKQAGFTLVELMVAMSVFSFMLLIIMVGFMNIVRLHNAAIASNVAQDNARIAMDDMVRAIRDSTGVVTTPPPGPNGTLCLKYSAGPQQFYFTEPVGPGPNAQRILYRSEACGVFNPRTKITNDYVSVVYFRAEVKNFPANPVRPHIALRIKVASSNATTSNTGDATVCQSSNQARAFCSVVELRTGATPR
jgi:prepilin-type N-terminal cleavage/methylation domain-containing protein